MVEATREPTGDSRSAGRNRPKLRKVPAISSSALARLVFWSALLAGVLYAFLPLDHLMWDKAEHFLSFYALTVLGMIAFPERSAAGIGLCLSGLGAAIEIVQGTPLVHRDCEFWDWGAETIGIGVALSTSWIAVWRHRRRNSARP